MASTMYATFENHHHVRGTRSQHASRMCLLSHPLNAYNLEAVGESDMRSQRTAEVCHPRLYTLSASEDSCSMRRKVDACHSAATFSSCKAFLTTRAGRNHFRKQLKEELGKVQSMISILEAREFDVRSFSQLPELETNVSSSKSACEPAHIHGEFSEEKDFLSTEERLGVLVRPKTKGGVKRVLNLNADLHSKRQKFDSDAKKLADLMRQCGTILKKLRTHKYSWVFNQPVDFVALQIPDYPMIIKQPMDLGTIKSKMELHEYVSPLDFAADVRLTFANAMKFNPKGHDVHFMADFLSKIFEERWKNLDKKLKQLNLHSGNRVRSQDEPAETLVQSFQPWPVAGHSSATLASRQRCQNLEDAMSNSCQMSYEEKQILSQMLEEVPMEKLDQVMEIIKRKDPEVKPVDGEVTIEIDCLDSNVLWELYNLLKHPKVASKSICQGFKPQDGEYIQIASRGGILSQTALSEGDDKDEEVDIGVDAPTISYAPVDIDKDVAACSSSSSGTSSSSGSDLSNTSQSDSDADDAQSCGSEAKPSPGKVWEGVFFNGKRLVR